MKQVTIIYNNGTTEQLQFPTAGEAWEYAYKEAREQDTFIRNLFVLPVTKGEIWINTIKQL